MLGTIFKGSIRAVWCIILLLGGTAAAAAQQPGFQPEFAIIQLNDIYRIDAVDDGKAGGLGRIATLVADTRKQVRGPVLILHAGDFIAPSFESRYFSGIQMIDAMNFLHARAPLYAVPGNHEFDERTPAMLAGAISASHFPWLASNILLKTGEEAVDQRIVSDTLLDLGRMKVGIFALTFLDAPRQYATMDSAFVTLAEQAIQRLEDKGAEVIIGLTHLSREDDEQIARLRRAHPRLMWIAGGHEHFLQRQEMTDTTALITKGDANARRVWKLLFGFRNGEPAMYAQPIEVNTAIPIDPEYQRVIQDRYRAELNTKIPFFEQVIGRSAVRLDATEETVRDAESNWGNYLADLMRSAYPDIPVDVAVLNGGAIRIDDTFSGDIRWEHLARTFGFPTRVALVWLRGSDLKRTLLEHSVSGGRGEGRFLQVSGVRFTFNRGREPGSRVSEVRVEQDDEWVPLEEDRIYVVAVPDYLYGGGDGYQFKQRAVLTVPPGPELKLLAFEALTEMLGRGEAIAPEIEGRIVEER
jgi:2',3'-cyclic-nucleotide 2'-phosphodiesterase (5'-nucleotidase family)